MRTPGPDDVADDSVTFSWEPSRQGPRPGRATLLPDPEPRAIRVPVISVDDHLIEPPDLFEGRLPASLPDRAPRVVEDDDGTPVPGSSRGTATPTSASTPWWAAPAAEWSMEPARFDEMRPRLLRHRGPDRRHGPGRHLGLAVLPVPGAGFCGAVFSRPDDPELGLACLRAFNDWHLEEWAGTAPRAHHPAAAALAGRRRGGHRRGARQRRTRVQGGELPRVPGPAPPPVHLQRRTGTPSSPPARRPAPSCACTPGPRRWAPLPSPDPPFELLPTVFPVNALLAAAEWLWSGRAAALPGAGGGHVRGRHRLGADADGPGRLRAGPLGVGHREPRLALRPAPERGAAAQLLVLLHRRPVGGAAAARHRRRPHHGGERLPARRLVLARHPGRARGDLGRAARRRAARRGGRQRLRGCSATPCRRVDDWRRPAP